MTFPKMRPTDFAWVVLYPVPSVAACRKTMIRNRRYLHRLREPRLVAHRPVRHRRRLPDRNVSVIRIRVMFRKREWKWSLMTLFDTAYKPNSLTIRCILRFVLLLHLHLRTRITKTTEPCLWCIRIFHSHLLHRLTRVKTTRTIITVWSGPPKRKGVISQRF